MKEHPIIFNAEMVRAILDGRKTQTRRVVKPQPERTVTDWSHDANAGEVCMHRGCPVRLLESRGRNKRDAGELTPSKITCPYGSPGDRLWVRETWLSLALPDQEAGEPVAVVYRADSGTEYWASEMDYRWRPSIHMPRWASRLSLTVTGVRVERVQEIDWREVVAEGACTEKELLARMPSPLSLPPGTSRDGVNGLLTVLAREEVWKPLWDSINEKRGYGWDKNPWVWVIEFEEEAR